MRFYQKLVLVNFKVMLISSKGRIGPNFYI